ncbi:hypothetical protein [Pseudomonas sp. PDM19]|uniref:hypothetical protein n=1 Tax=Pseudomonas sp. PDM19 TaxID=2769272 RepID=UPI001780E825|nr:hypothetical protein [Pseudomonas sp. PDM19]MBD9630734.1 hypothetical protein [Pseudomonas sp. PDM19]
MGRAKEEWMRLDEERPMRDWIEENFGDDAGNEGSPEWEAAVEAYYEFCRNESFNDWDEQDELEWFISKSPKDSLFGIFNVQLKNISELLSVEVSDETRFSLLVMLHAHTVAALEAYLESNFIKKVTNSDTLIRRLVETDPTFSTMKFTLKEIFEKQERLKLTVAEHLKNLIFHDLKKIKPMYKSVLECDFGDIDWLFKAVQLRHHCAHRAGFDKEGIKVDITPESITSLVEKSRFLVNKIELETFFFEPDDIEL